MGFLLCVIAGCSATPPATRITGGSADAGSGATQDAGSTTGGTSEPFEASVPDPLPRCDAGADADQDGDGFSINAGDCYDCDALINPGAYDFPDNAFDEDCSGSQATKSDSECDRDLAIDSFAAEDGARAIGLCEFATPDSAHWGVLSARYTSADGSRALNADEAVRVGVLPEFGVEQPPQGKRMLSLSSGAARALGQAGYTENCGDYYTSGTDGWPEGYPRPSPACGDTGSEDGGDPLLFDPSALELRVRVPSNAKGLSFATNFYTYEYPSFICSSYNDYFLVLMDPMPVGKSDSNIVFDADGNWISVNNGLLQVCRPGTHGGKTFECKLGTDELANTGYAESDTACGEGAATGWLRTAVPVVPGSTITLRFAIWDTDDPNRDSLVLIDDLVWNVETPAAVETVPIIF